MPRLSIIVFVAVLWLSSSLGMAQQPAAYQPQVQPQAQPQIQPQQAVAPPRNPFVVPPAHQAWLDQVLAKWEADSNQVKNFYCDFKRNQHNINGPNPNAVSLYAQEEGKLGYNKPDQGSFEITSSLVWNPKAQPLPDPNQPAPAQAAPLQGEYKPARDTNGQELPGDHWVCSGKNIYQYRAYATPKKQLVVTPIPPQMQGEQIVDGPLPFLFGAKAEKLKARFWFEPAKELCKEGYIGIHAKPKFAKDAVEYSDVWIALRNEPGKPLMPAGLRVLHPNGSWDEYVFDLNGAQVNGMLAGLMNSLFSEPRTPFGWERVVENMQMPQQAQQPQPNNNIK